MSKKNKTIQVKAKKPVYTVTIDGFRVEGSMKWCERMIRNAEDHSKAVSEVVEVKNA